MTLAASLRRSLFGVSTDEVRFVRRQFRGDDPRAIARIEGIGATFLTGYHAALTDSSPAPLAARLGEVALEERGFAFEGAGMALTLLDAASPFGKQRLARFLEGPGNPHEYMVNIGAGWAIARLGGFSRRLGRLSQLGRFLALDGLGFHMGYFKTAAYVDQQQAPRRLAGHDARAFDQGLGRSLWFVEGAGPDRIAATIARFPEPRHADLWAGAGLACAYAGGVERAVLEATRDRAGPHLAPLAQGAAFAAMARARAGNPAAHTALACEILWRRPLDEVVGLARAGGEGLPPDGEVPAYEVWRTRIQQSFLANASTTARAS